jgi:cysteine-rich repeat protein
LGSNPTSSAEWRLLDGTLTEIATGDLDQDLVATGLTAGTYYLELTRTSSTSYFSATYKVSALSEVPVCGNGTIESGETCDDGNTADGDGCTSACELGTPTVSVTNNTSGAIDATTPTLTRVATVSGCTAPVWAVSIDVDITHTWRGDLNLDLTSPGSTVVRLHDGSGSSSDDIIGNYPTTLAVEGPGALSDFVTETGNGDWELFVEDTATSYDDGTFNSYTVNLYCE